MGKIHKLEEVEVDTIGLVTKGANRRKFFLTKSENVNSEEENMAEQNITPAMTEDQIRKVAEDAVVEKTDGLIKSFFNSLFKTQDTEEDTEKVEPAVIVIPDEIQKKLDLVDDLAATTNVLKTQLEKAEKELADARVIAEEKEYLAKADTFKSVGTDRVELAKFMAFLNKADATRLAWFEEFVKGVDIQLSEAGIYAEFGKNHGAEQSDDPVEALIKSGEAKDYREAYIKLGENERDAETLLDQRRKELKRG